MEIITNVIIIIHNALGIDQQLKKYTSCQVKQLSQIKKIINKWYTHLKKVRKSVPHTVNGTNTECDSRKTARLIISMLSKFCY